MTLLVPIEHPWIDASEAPLYVMRFPKLPADDDLVALCAVREAWAAVAKYPVAWICDLSNVLEVTARQRRLFADHLERFEAHDIAFNRGSALVVPNTLLRGVVTAVFWIKPPRFPNQIFPTRELAHAWAMARLRGTPETADARSVDRGSRPHVR